MRVSFGKLGFYVVWAAIHVRIDALSNGEREITPGRATKEQVKRHGLALWFRDKDAIAQRDCEMLVPRILGKTTIIVWRE